MGAASQIFLQRHDGEGLGPRALAAAAGGVVQPLHQYLHQIHHHPGMARDQRLEAFGADAQQVRCRAAPQAGRCVRWLPAISDISPTVSPAGTRATMRRWPCASATKTPRQPVTTRNRAASFSPSRSSSVPPGRPNQLASARRLLQRRVAHILQQRETVQAFRAALRDRPSAARCGRRRGTPCSCFYHQARPATINVQAGAGHIAGGGRRQEQKRTRDLFRPGRAGPAWCGDASRAAKTALAGLAGKGPGTSALTRMPWGPARRRDGG